MLYLFQWKIFCKYNFCGFLCLLASKQMPKENYIWSTKNPIKNITFFKRLFSHKKILEITLYHVT